MKTQRTQNRKNNNRVKVMNDTGAVQDEIQAFQHECDEKIARRLLDASARDELVLTEAPSGSDAGSWDAYKEMRADISMPVLHLHVIDRANRFATAHKCAHTGLDRSQFEFQCYECRG